MKSVVLQQNMKLYFEAKDANENVRHHEHTARAQLQFFEKVGKLYRVMKEMGNHFPEDTADLFTFDTKIIATPDAGETVTSHYQTGESRFKAFMWSLDKADEVTCMILSRRIRLTFFNINQSKLLVTSSKRFKKMTVASIKVVYIIPIKRLWPGILSPWEPVFSCCAKWWWKTTQLSKVSACFNSGGQICNNRY